MLHSEKDGKNYIGYTSDINSRLLAHNEGHVKSTKARRPLILIYFEACLTMTDALRRERYFKTHYGHMFVKKRLKDYYESKS